MHSPHNNLVGLDFQLNEPANVAPTCRTEMAVATPCREARAHGKHLRGFEIQLRLAILVCSSYSVSRSASVLAVDEDQEGGVRRVVSRELT